MRYHLWTVLSSRAGPYGVLDSGAVTGAARPVPYCGLSGSGGCSEAYSRSAPLPLSPSGGSLGSGGSATGPLHCNVCNIAHAVFFVKGRAGISGQIWIRAAAPALVTRTGPWYNSTAPPAGSGEADQQISGDISCIRSSSWRTTL